MNRYLAMTSVLCMVLACCQKPKESARSGSPAIEVTDTNPVVEAGESKPSQPPIKSVKVPRRPFFPGVKQVGQLNRIMRNATPGEKTAIQLAFENGSSDTVEFTAPNVLRGSVTFYTEEATIRILPGRKIEVIQPDRKLREESGVPRWGLTFYRNRNTDIRADATCLQLTNIDSEDDQKREFRLPHTVSGGITFLAVRFEFSKDYAGDRGDWYVMMPL
jgi:hypothetical protein